MYNETKQPHRWSWFRDHDSVTLPLGCCSILIWCNYGFTLMQNANILFTDGDLARLLGAKQGKCDPPGIQIYSFEIYQRWIDFPLYPPNLKEAVIHASGTVCAHMYICSVFGMCLFVTLSLSILKLRLGTRKKNKTVLSSRIMNSSATWWWNHGFIFSVLLFCLLYYPQENCLKVILVVDTTSFYMSWARLLQ